MNERAGPPISLELPDPWLIATYSPRNALLPLIYPNNLTLNQAVGKMAAEMDATCTRIRKGEPADRPSVVTVDQVCEWLMRASRLLVYRTFSEATRRWKEYIRERRKVTPYPLRVPMDPKEGLRCLRPIIDCPLPKLGSLEPVLCALRFTPKPEGPILDVIPVGYALYEIQFQGTWDDPSLWTVGERIDVNVHPDPDPERN